MEFLKTSLISAKGDLWCQVRWKIGSRRSLLRFILQSILIRQSWKQICQTIPRCHHFIKIQNKTNQPKIKFMFFEGKKWKHILSYLMPRNILIYNRTLIIRMLDIPDSFGFKNGEHYAPYVTHPVQFNFMLL